MAFVDPVSWANDMRAAIAQMAGAMRVIELAEQQPEWKAYFDAWRHDPSLSKSTRSLVKSLLPAVISISQDLDDPTLTELGIDASALPHPTGFAAQTLPEPLNLKIAQVDMHETPTETAHEILVLTKPTRVCSLQIKQVSDGLAVGIAETMLEVSAGVFTHTIDWSVLAVAEGYYLIEVTDGYELDAVLIEIKAPPTKSLTQADMVWLLQNTQAPSGGGGGSTPAASANGNFI